MAVFSVFVQVDSTAWLWRDDLLLHCSKMDKCSIQHKQITNTIFQWVEVYHVHVITYLRCFWKQLKERNDFKWPVECLLMVYLRFIFSSNTGKDRWVKIEFWCYGNNAMKHNFFHLCNIGFNFYHTAGGTCLLYKSHWWQS